MENIRVLTSAVLEDGLLANLEEHKSEKAKWWEITVCDGDAEVEKYMVQNSDVLSNGFDINCYFNKPEHQDEVWDEFYTYLEDEWLQVYAKCNHCNKIIEVDNAVRSYLTERDEQRSGDVWYLCPECAQKDENVCVKCGMVAVGGQKKEFTCHWCK